MLDQKVIDGITESLKALPSVIRKDLMEPDYINEFPFTCELNLRGAAFNLDYDMLVTLKFEKK
jgi:hypothetical protein